ncbi:heme ABC exporter ATP-binding protein CcmA [Anaplasmataceae bacterium AB001_6]|nr:heme ABC exporter ATP-binding protein CcmA [Anaplasmataceae bacterium AB001_6]
MKIIEGKNLRIIRDEKIIMDNVNFKVAEKEYLKISGINGSGKTSFLRALAGFISFDAGSLFYNGKEQSTGSDRKDYSEKLIFLGKTDFMSENIKVISNLKYWASFYETEELLMPAVRFWSLDDVLDIPMYKLSSGWQKRVYFAYVMISNAYIWLIDEPFTNLDDDTQELLSGLFETRRSQRGIVIWTSNVKRDIIDTDNVLSL